MKVLVVTFLLLMASAHAASFDCAKANYKVEKIICEDPVLSSLDEALGRVYQQALSNSDNATQLVARQKQWLQDGRNKCSDKMCLKLVYPIRIYELSIAGTYNHTDTICEKVNAEADSIEWGNCQEGISAITIKESGEKHYDFQVEGELYFSNWNQCNFKSSSAQWIGDRLTARSDETNDCQLTLFFFGGALHTVASGECSLLCGIRGSLDGVVLEKVKGPQLKY